MRSSLIVCSALFFSLSLYALEVIVAESEDLDMFDMLLEKTTAAESQATKNQKRTARVDREKKKIREKLGSVLHGESTKLKQEMKKRDSVKGASKKKESIGGGVPSANGAPEEHPGKGHGGPPEVHPEKGNLKKK